MSQQLHADVAVIGGGLGGFAAALAAARTGKKVIMTEETDWIGGQITSQGVPPDENRWIEETGCTRSYRQFRNGVRDYYRAHFPLTEESKAEPNFNPGGALVSRISHDPRAALAVMNAMAAPFVFSGKMTILLEHVPVAAQMEGDAVRSVDVKCTRSGELVTIVAPYVLDATELGDLLPLTGTEFVTGAESKAETGEMHALDAADPMDMQAITYCFAMDYIEGEDHTIEKPRDYEFWRKYRPDFWPANMLDWVGPHPITHEPREYVLFPHNDQFPLFNYRRIAQKSNYAPGTFEGDATIVNWPQNDYLLGPIINVSEEEKQRHLEGAKQLSLSLLYWLQTEAPHPDGKTFGYPGLRLRKDILGTKDGLAKHPYIRESRRIKALFTIIEQHITKPFRPDGRAEQFPDTVGIGYYAIDLHPSTGNRNYLHFSPLPFQIPLGSLIPIRTKNLLAANKNIGTTHITNGCYRLHPVEWNVGEASGLLASFCMDHDVMPREVWENKSLLEQFQGLLVKQGIELSWKF